MGYIGDGPKPELEVGDISTKDVTATGDLTVDTNTLFVDASADAVGIGTSSPNSSSTLHVKDQTDIAMSNNADGQITIEGNGYSGAIALNATGMQIYQNSNVRSLIFGNNETEQMRIDSSGNVGIGTTSLTSSSGYTTLSINGTTGGQLSFQTGGTGESYIFNDATDFSIYNSNAGSLKFFTNATEKARITTDGLTFNGDTAAANALDDYEEGSWTPVVAAGWTSVSFPNSYQFGKYQKVGNVVEAFFFIQFSGTNAGAHVQINGLPYVAVNETAGALRGGALTYFTIPVDSTGMVLAYVFQNATNFRLYAGNDGGASTLSNGDASDAYLIGSVKYRVS